MTLRLKLFLLLAGIVVFSTSGVTAVALWGDLQREQELLEREGAAMAAAIAPEVARFFEADGAVRPGLRETLDAMVERLVATEAVDRAWVVDRAGRVVGCHDHTAEGCPERPITTFAPAASPVDALLRLVEPRGLETSAPVLKEGQLVGAIRVHFTRDEVLRNARRLAWGAAAVAAFWIVLGQTLAMILIAAIIHTIGDVVDAAEQVGHGEGGEQIEVPGDRELADLAIAFNGMSARLAARREENQRLIATLEQRVAEKTRDLLRADRLATLGGIAAGFAHELGNSLNVIRGYTSVVLRELPPEAAHRADLEMVKRETHRAASLMERFLVFARSRDTRTAVQPVEPVLREAVEVARPAATQARVKTSVEIAEGVPEVNADAELLRQAFLNLCVNAVQAMGSKGGGSLAVRLYPEGDDAVAEFKDDGPGIAPEVASHVFEPFYTTKAEGTGLGLAIVRQAAETHGGTVEVESAPGQGATFRIRLPAASAAAAKEATA